MLLEAAVLELFYYPMKFLVTMTTASSISNQNEQASG
jgi:hypothetical protein